MTGEHPPKTTMLNSNQLSEYRELKDWSVEVEKETSVKPHTGEETASHLCAKSLAMLIGVRNDYIVNSEVSCPGGDIDIVFWGNPDRLSYAVECETSPTQEVLDDKRERYVGQTPLDDMLTINVTKCPMHRPDALEYVSEQLGLSP